MNMECSISNNGRLQLSFNGAGSCEEVRRSGVILLTMVCGITLSRKITAQQRSFILMESSVGSRAGDFVIACEPI